MSQKRRHSLLEVTLSTLCGYVIALVTQAVVFPLYGMEINMEQSMEIAAIFTVISILRGYVFRRVFNWFT